MPISEINQIIDCDWPPNIRRIQRAVFAIRPAILSTFLKRLFGFKRGWITLQGVKFYIDPISHFGQEVITTGKYEPIFCDTLMGLLKEGDYFLDIGANEGFFSMKAVMVVGPQGKVFAVEPQPELVKVISRNSEANSFQNVQISQLAFSEKKGEVELALSFSVNSGASSLFQEKVSGIKKVKVPAERFDDWWIKQGSPQFDVVKIDCEGAELFVFRSAQKALSQHFSKMICLEYHEHIIGAEGVWEIDDKLRLAGYELSEFQSGVWVYHLPNISKSFSNGAVRRSVPRLRPHSSGQLS